MGGLELGTDDQSENTAEGEREDWSSEELGRGWEEQQGNASVKCESSL